MKVLLFGATGMLGQGVLHVARRDPRVEEVLVVGRTALGQTYATLREIVRGDLMDLSSIEDQPLRGVTSKTRWYRTAYTLATPLMWLMHRVAPGRISTTDQIGEAMIAVAHHGAPTAVLENAAIRVAAEADSGEG